jgi:hypothetical protein
VAESLYSMIDNSKIMSELGVEFIDLRTCIRGQVGKFIDNL